MSGHARHSGTVTPRAGSDPVAYNTEPPLAKTLRGDYLRTMAILKIARMGHPVLVRRADPVADPAAPEIRRLVADMLETMEDASGVGLAAPQLHVPLRLFVYRVPARRTTGLPVGPTVLINPEIEPLTDDVQHGWESCLSIPGLRAAVPRHRRIRYAGLGLDGATVSGDAEGYQAVVMQHEYDHLNGILYPMRLQDFTRFGFEPEILDAHEGAAP